MDTCQWCGIAKEDVWWGVDPFAFEIYDDATEILICDECSSERSDEI